MKVIFYDVEHGSCCQIITPNKKHILVDIGSKSDKSLAEYICNTYSINNLNPIDALIITHPHEDHIYDLPNLMSLQPPRVIHCPKQAFDLVPVSDDVVHQTIVKTANTVHRTYTVPVPEEHNPFNPSNNGGVDIHIISPKQDWTTKDDLNTFSSIIVLKYSGYKFVLTGDNPSGIVQKMLDENYRQINQHIADATVLLAPHHGRAKEFCSDFFKCVNPLLTVVSDKNIVHETQMETSHIYRGRGCKINGQNRYVLTTRCDGTITFEIEFKTINITFGCNGY